MKTIPSLIPGSPAWMQSRSASKAPAVMGVSKFQTRTELLRQMATGLTKDVDAGTQRLFDAGHASEAAARDIAEDILCEQLSPVCGTTDDGYLTASFDGLTFDGNVAFEHKLWNETLAAAVRADDLPEEYKIQMDQQILVGGLDFVLFMCSDGTRLNCVSTEYRSTPERLAKLLAGWRQFDKDLAEYQHVDEAPAAVAAPITELPALLVEISGSVTASNLTEWKAVVTERIAGINTDLQTDNDFADADAMVKFLDIGEKKIDLVKSQAQSKAADIDAVFRALDEIKATMRTKRLELDKLVTKRKESIKVEIMQAGKDQLAAHIASLNKRLAKVAMPPLPADFATAIKGKRNLAAMRDAVSTLVAAKKIESNELADKIDANLKTLATEAEHHLLFADLATLTMKAPDDLALIIRTRIADHTREEEKRAELAREKIRAEEEVKAAAKVKAEQEAEIARNNKIIADEAERQRKASEEAAAKAVSDRAHDAIMEEHRTLEIARATKPAAQAAPNQSGDRLDETSAAAGLNTTAKLRGQIDAALDQCTYPELQQIAGFIIRLAGERSLAA
jgi:predicted phage-related endonuclease